MFISIRPQVFKFLKRGNISCKLEEQKIITNWQDIIENINRDACGKSQALYIDKTGQLVVSIINSAWLQELSFYTEDIKRQINKKGSIVKSIRLTINDQ